MRVLQTGLGHTADDGRFVHPRQRLADVLQHPGRPLLRVLREFRTNQGLLLAGAVYGSLTTALPYW